MASDADRGAKPFAKTHRDLESSPWLQEASGTVKASFGDVFVYAHGLRGIVHDSFRHEGNLLFPYGLFAVSQNGHPLVQHVYITALTHAAADPKQYYRMRVFLPDQKEPYLSVARGRRQEKHSPEPPLVAFDLFTTAGHAEAYKKGELNWFNRVTGRMPDGHVGLLAVPDDLELVRNIEVAFDMAPSGAWKDSPWDDRDAAYRARQQDAVRAERERRGQRAEASRFRKIAGILIQ